MTYTVRFRIPMPIAAYDGMHAVIRDVAGSHTGLLAHLAWETTEGFEIIEVWEARESYERFMATVWPQVAQRLGMGATPPPAADEVELRGLVLPATRPMYV